MNSLAMLFFLCFLILLAYIYFGYPALLWLLTRRRRYVVPPLPDKPSVSLIIAAFNEERVIEQKIRNTLELTYPADRLEVIVASDGSEDRTDEIVHRYADQGIRLLRMPTRQGKMPAILTAAEAAGGNILVFSDANAMYTPDALCRLVEPFADPNTGCVSGRLIYENRQATPVSRGETLYWNYENRLKALESRFHTLLGANGSMYAIRRAAYRPLDPDVSDDFGLPLAVYAQGYRVVFQPAAVSREEAPSTPGMEFRKKSRFVSHQLTTLSRLWPMLKPLERPRFLFQLMSHKLLRNMAPFFLIGMLGTSFSIPAPYGPALLSLQGLFYGAAVMGMALQRLRRPFRLFTLPFYFCLVNAAAVAGIAHFFRRKNYAAWNEK